jgi:hypothetical protein
MFASCAASRTKAFWLGSTALTRAWHVDFEYRLDACHHPVPVCMFAQEQHTGQEISLRHDELLKLRRAPFDTGPNDLLIAYSAHAELSCFQALGWPFPYNTIDVFVETCAAINGLEIEGLEEKRPNILEALELFGLPSRYTKAEKEAMRQLILNHASYSAEQWIKIEDYNRSDVEATLALMPFLSPTFDLPRVLHRGRFIASAITSQEWCGLPIDDDCLNEEFLENWEVLQLHFIARDDDFGLYDGTSFVEQRLYDLIDAKRWDWPRLASGKYKKDKRTFGKQAQRYPELKRTARLRENIADLRINKLADAVGADGFCRCWPAPFGSKTGRNQPSGRVFLPALPTWLRGLLRPPAGWTLIELDWDAQEVGVMAGLSGDPAMIEDYRSGDPHWSFGVRAGLVPKDADKRDYRELRDKVFKPIVHGMNYGMTAYGIAAKTGRSLLWSRAMHAAHGRTYPVFHQRLGDMVAQAKFDRSIFSPFGWPMAVTGNTKHRTLMNFPAQASGADAMRIAGIAAAEAGIRVCCSVHDAFWILAPEGDEARTIAAMREIMERAGAAVSNGLPITVSVKAWVTSTCNLGDGRKPGDKGFDMWTEVRQFLNGLRRRTG